MLDENGVHRVFVMMALVVNFELVFDDGVFGGVVGRIVCWDLTWVCCSGWYWYNRVEYVGFSCGHKV